MVRNAPPSTNPANANTLTGLFNTVLTKFLQGVEGMLPAKVLAYNRATNRASVQPLISMTNTLDEVIPRAQVASIPVQQYGGGGFVMSFPITTGNLGWLKSNDRDITFFKKGLGMATPNTQRLHKFSDAVLFPDVMTVQIADEDLNNAVLQNTDGTVRISLWPTKIKVTAPNFVIGNVPGYAPSSVGALIDMVSTTKALGLPAMTTGQKNAIPSPRPGFQVFDTSLDRVSTYTAGGGWTP